ncbi:MAG: DUF2459 domain-containing protein, partial [bacterium]|nr:DUF2459 domain-containing protein [bacterium]
CGLIWLRLGRAVPLRDRCVSPFQIPAPAGSDKKYEDWAYGEQLWMWENRKKFADRARGCWEGTKGAFHALCWPTAGVVEVSRADRPYTELFPQEAIRGWVIEVSPGGLERMRAWLEASRASDKPFDDEGWQHYYASVYKYDLFFTCHHYVARALREAGVPVHPGRCWLPRGFWSQLDGLAVSSFQRAGAPSRKAGL